MDRTSRGRVDAPHLACLALAGCLLAALPARTNQPALYDPDRYASAGKALAASDVDGAVRAYCDMLSGNAPGTLWTLSAVLLCDAAEVAPTVASIQGIQPVFVQAKMFQGKWCYRVCVGLSRDKGAPFKWRYALPPKLLAEGPFPVPVMLPCSRSGIDSAPAAGTRVAPPSAPAEPPPAGASPGAKPPALTPEAAARTPAGGVEGTDKPRRAEGEAWFQRGLSAQNAGRRSEAEEDYRRSLAADPDRPEVLNNLGVLYLQQNRFEEAKALFAKAISRSPSYARAHLNLAGAMWGLEDRNGALMEAREAVSLDPSDVSARLTLASFLLAQGQKTEASEQARRVLLLDPENAQAKVFLTSPGDKPAQATKP